MEHSEQGENVPLDDTTARDDTENDADDLKPLEEEQLPKIKKQRPKLTFEFFRSAKDDGPSPEVDRLWDLFLDVAADFPTLEDMMATSNEKRVEVAMREHLDQLLCQLRRWTQKEFPAGLSLREFAERTEKQSAKPEFHDYRTALLRKYKTTNWKVEAIQRKNNAAYQEPITDVTDENNAGSENQKPVTNEAPMAPASASISKERREQLLALQREKRAASQAAAAATVTTPTDTEEQRRRTLQQRRQEALEKQRRRREAALQHHT